ncbi:MAG: hypothetical protein NWR72_08620 [Bacteroidia bacterium]|nr:hypothetical protein [Bacteroidia bacterium]
MKFIADPDLLEKLRLVFERWKEYHEHKQEPGIIRIFHSCLKSGSNMEKGTLTDNLFENLIETWGYVDDSPASR